MASGRAGFDKTLCEELLSMMGEKILVVRHDVDNIYCIFRPRLGQKLIKLVNYGFLSLLSPESTRWMREYIPFYESHIYRLLDIERSMGARSTLFFRVVTMPTKKLYRELVEGGFEIAYHSDRNNSYESWIRDLRYLEEKLRVKIKGFTKHGYGPVRSGGPWDEEKFISYASRAGLKYLAQGGSHYEWETPRKIRKVWVFSHHVTIKKASDTLLKEYIKSKCIPMLLVHPEDLGIPGNTEKFQHALSIAKGVPAYTVVEYIEKIMRERLEYAF